MDAHDTVTEMPPGYRWADECETERWDRPGYFTEMVQIRTGGTDDEPTTDLAIRIEAFGEVCECGQSAEEY